MNVRQEKLYQRYICIDQFVTLLSRSPHTKLRFPFDHLNISIHIGVGLSATCYRQLPCLDII